MVGKTPRRMKLGEMLLAHDIITEDQMKAALDMQSTMGGRLGQNLIRLNYLHEETLLEFLAEQTKIPPVDLRTRSVPPEVQRLVPLETIQRFGVLPIEEKGGTLFLGMTDPTNLDSLKELEFSLGKKIAPMVIAESQWVHAVNFFKNTGWGKESLPRKGEVSGGQDENYDLPDLMGELLTRGGSDIHLSIGAPPTFRVLDQLVRANRPSLTATKISRLLFDILPSQQREMLGERNEIDVALTFMDVGRFRVNIYRQRGNLAAALRHVVEEIPSLEELSLPSWLSDFASRKQGLILITGPSGHGKSTTLACLIDIINSTRRVNVVTLEDPIEYVHYHKMSNVNQRELGMDTDSFADGIRYIFRQDPDVISIGEMRDFESISTALTAAETGHLVLATLHTLNATSTIDRIIDVFPGDQQNQVRHQLADSLLVVLSQRLVPRADGEGRILAFERLSNSHRIQNAVREGRVHLIRSQSSGGTEDFSPMELSLAQLFRRGLITLEEGRKFAEDPKSYDMMVQKR
jgi:twitching motility protein PilT